MARLILILSLMFPPLAAAQLDSTSTVLLRPGSKPSKTPSLDSSRYKIRQPESRKGDDDEIEEKPGTYIASPVPTPTGRKTQVRTQTTVTNTAPAPMTGPVVAPPVAAPITPAPEEKPAIVPVEPPPVTVQVKELIFGGTNQDIDDYKKAVHPEDPRANMLSISIAPAYYYNGSESNYAYRRYSSHGPGIGLGMNLWVTPFFGLHSKFFSSVSASQKSGTNSVPTDLQNFEAGIRFRKHFGLTRKSPQISFGIDWHDGINKISKESTESIGRKSTGLSFALEGEIPSTNTYSHLFQLDVRPRLKHSEMNTGIETRSGTKNQTNSISLSGGGQWTMDRHNQVFWKVQYLIERNLFDGQALQPDPGHGGTPDGVSVTNSLVIFYFGFKWGS